MKNEDVELIHRILAGDETAFVDLVKKYQKQVHALAWRKIGDFHIAEEITQDTFLKVYQKLSTLKDPNQFSGWLYVIATRQCLSWLRKKRIETESLEDIDTEWIDETAYSRYVAEEHAKTTTEAQREVVKKLLAKLKESERTVMTLHYFGEMTVEEISRFLGVSTSAIKIRLHRARQRLKKEEPMIREALSNFQLSPNLTDNIMQKVEHIKPAAPSGSKPLVPWVIGASTALLIVLMLGIGSQYLARFQQPYSLDTQSDMAVELVDTPVVQNIEEKPDIRNQLGKNTENQGNSDGDGQESNQMVSDKGDYTKWNLPKGAKARLSKGSINDISFSPDGTQIAVGSATGVWVYDARTGAELSLLTDHATRADILAYSSDGKTLATGRYDRISLWDIGTGKLIKSYKREESVIHTLKITGDGKTLLCKGYDGSVRLWDIATGEKKDFLSKSAQGFNALLRHVLGSNVTEADLYLNKNNDDSIFAVGFENGEIRLEDAITGEHLKTLQDRKGRKNYVHQLAFSPDGTLLVSNTSETPLHLWNVNSGKLLNTLTENPRIRGILTFSKDGKTLACQSSKMVELWDVATQTLRATLTEIDVLTFSPDSKTVAGANWKGEIKVWDSNTGDKLLSFTTRHINGIQSLVYSPDSKTIASEHGGTIQLWDAINFTQMSKRIHIKTWGPAIVFSNDGKIIKIGEKFIYKKHSRGSHVKESLIGTVSLWNTSTGNKLYDFSVESHSGELPKLPARSRYSSGIYGNAVFSQDGNMFAVALNSTHATKDNKFSIYLWGVSENPFKQSHTILKGHSKNINVLAFSPSSSKLASGSEDGTIRIWNTRTGTEISSLSSDKTRALAFSVDGKILASGSTDGTIRLWDVAMKTQLKTLEVENDTENVLAISPDNEILASGTHEGVIHLWDIATGNKLSTLEGHSDWVSSLTFSPDGKTLASGSSDGALFLWNLP